MPRCRALLIAAACLLASAAAAEVAPAAAPPGQVVILAGHARDGRGGMLRDVRIGIADGTITSLNAADTGAMIDLRGYPVLPGWIDTHAHLASHFDRTGRIATDSEPPAEAALGIAGAAWIR